MNDKKFLLPSEFEKKYNINIRRIKNDNFINSGNVILKDSNETIDGCLNRNKNFNSINKIENKGLIINLKKELTILTIDENNFFNSYIKTDFNNYYNKSTNFNAVKTVILLLLLFYT